MKKTIKGIDYPGISVTYACHDGKGKYAMHKRSNNCRDEQGTWDFGGGGVKLHETVVEALRREVMEEYCTNIMNYEFLGYRDMHRKHEGVPTHWVVLDFKVLVDPRQVGIGEPEKFDDIGWFELADLPKKLHSGIKSHLKMYKDKLFECNK